jgi:hypothetical protein
MDRKSSLKELRYAKVSATGRDEIKTRQEKGALIPTQVVNRGDSPVRRWAWPKPRAESQRRDDSELSGPSPFRPVRIQRKTSKRRLSGLSLIMCERPRSDHSRAQCLAVMGLGSGSVTLRRPQFRQAKTVIANPASRSTARSGNMAPRHLSQVYIHFFITLDCRTNHPPEVPQERGQWSLDCTVAWAIWQG